VRRRVVAPIVEAAVQALDAAADAKGLHVETVVDPAVSAIAADPERFHQILWNLLSNAVKFTPPGGTVRGEASLAGQQLRITVTDTGIGFTPEVARHLFEHFRQADSSTTRAYGGLGLGLGIVRQLVELHGGTVSAESAGPNRGATFTIVLPIGTLPD